MIFIEKDNKKTFLSRILRTLCLLIPIAGAFAGYFFAPAIWNLFSQKKATELLRFICSIAFFAIPTIVIFILTRKFNPVMKIEVKNN